MSKIASYTQLFRYAFMALPLSFAGIPLYVHVPKFYADHYQVSLLSLGVCLLAVRLLDAFQDPYLGYLSQRFVNKRLGMMVVAFLLLCASFAGIFLNPFSTSLPTIIWLGFTLFIATLCFSFLSVNLLGLAATWQTSFFNKNEINASREVMGLFGLLAAVITPTVLAHWMSEADAFKILSACLLTLAVLALWLFVPWYQRYGNASKAMPIQKRNLLSQIQSLTPSTRYFLMVYGISMLASAIPAVLVLFFIEDILQLPSYAGLFLAGYFLSACAGIPFWNWLAKRHKKEMLWAASMAVASFCFLGVLFLEQGNLWAYLAICVVTGICLGAELVFPPSILSDAAVQHEQTEHVFVHYGVFTFLAKFALAIVSLMAFAVLGEHGYTTGKAAAAPALFTLQILYGLVPSALKALSAGLMLKYTPTNKERAHETPSKTIHHRSDHHA